MLVLPLRRALLPTLRPLNKALIATLPKSTRSSNLQTLNFYSNRSLLSHPSILPSSFFNKTFTIHKYYSTVSNIDRRASSKSESSKSSSKKSSTRSSKVLPITLLIVVSAIAISPRLRQSLVNAFDILDRVGVVVVATTRCFALYLRTLGRDYPTEEEYQNALSKTHKKAADITLNALRKNAGIYIKIGQHLGAMTYLLPFEWTNTMVPLQDECPESSFEDVKAMFEKDTGVKLTDYFSEFDENPIGTASLAQVHVARLKSNDALVAVKIEHPSLARFVPLDVWLTKTVFDLMYKVFPQYPLTWLGDELQSSIYVELDFRNEARNAVKTDEYFKPYHKLTALRIPKVYASRQRILIMEYVGGARLDNLDYLDEHSISRAEVSSCLAHIFNNMIFQSGFVHCDPHHGNLAIRALDVPKDGHNFEIVLYDHGLYRTIPLDMKIDYAKFWLAMLDKDPILMRKYGKRFAGIGDDQYPLLAAALTGRDLEHATSGNVETERTQEEVDNMRELLMGDSLIRDLMGLLAKVPRIVLLILKTNDLVRHLDESLQNPLGNERTFLIMATYCAKTARDDEREANIRDHGKWSIMWLIDEARSWVRYYNRSFQLKLYDWVFLLSRLEGRLS
ncbi:DEKNAAC100978 [Brettanomyces naardenensis]|uniref:DEKNAAC100978 n=1 Tax=Brettanomyces naardenensis TaxID=13370 RepID=A0A448YH38_BRENA|nr:DEKNAAC100978 [Brettanomyces naardenensis]